ncbi:MAG: ABC transporter ATP-binding protein [Truepera sp.]|nr:ABC transporter ATP-binding protein [Truepera sp.]
MFDVRRLSAAYGLHQVLNEVSLTVSKGEMVVMLGANGAGKTTLLRAIAGLVPTPSASEICLAGQLLHRLPTRLRVEAGISLVPEGRGLFGDLTVRENLFLGAYPKRARVNERRNFEQVLALFPRLAERLGQAVRTMSGGEQQMVAIGRALMSEPRLLLLDEPSLGLSPLLCAELFRALQQIKGTSVSILLVEQNAKRSLAIADRGYLLESGRIVGEGTAEELRDDPAVQASYLGLGGVAASAT